DFFDANSGALQPAPPAPKPEVASVQPRGVRRGETARVRVTGKHLADLTEAKSGNAKLATRLAPEPASADGVSVELTPAGDFPIGAHGITLTALGGNATFNVYVEDIPQVPEKEAN